MFSKEECLDILIIGSDGAGCSAAIEAFNITEKIAIFTKSDANNSKTQRAQGGIQAATLPDDSVQLHYEICKL